MLYPIGSATVIFVVKIPNFIMALADSNSKANKSPLIKVRVDELTLDTWTLQSLLFLLRMLYVLVILENDKLNLFNVPNARAWNTDIATIVTAKTSRICVITTRISVTIGKNTNTSYPQPIY